jgi:hypothetical protein
MIFGDFLVLEQEPLARLDALPSVDVDRLKDEVLSQKGGLFQASLDRNAVEAGLGPSPNKAPFGFTGHLLRFARHSPLATIERECIPMSCLVG